MASHKDDLQRVGEVVERERISRGWTKEQAAREAGISSITWKRVEDAKRVQDTKLRAIEASFGWEYGALADAASGTQASTPKEPPAAVEVTDQELLAGLGAVARFAHSCAVRGATGKDTAGLVAAAVTLLDSVPGYSIVDQTAITPSGLRYDGARAARRVEARLRGKSARDVLSVINAETVEDDPDGMSPDQLRQLAADMEARHAAVRGAHNPHADVTFEESPDAADLGVTDEDAVQELERERSGERDRRQADR